jgi:hypothetical protein
VRWDATLQGARQTVCLARLLQDVLSCPVAAQLRQSEGPSAGTWDRIPARKSSIVPFASMRVRRVLLLGGRAAHPQKLAVTCHTHADPPLMQPPNQRQRSFEGFPSSPAVGVRRQGRLASASRKASTRSAGFRLGSRKSIAQRSANPWPEKQGGVIRSATTLQHSAPLLVLGVRWGGGDRPTPSHVVFAEARLDHLFRPSTHRRV